MMSVSLTPGRWRGLKTTSTESAVFTILAFDQRGSYRKMLPAGTSYEDAVAIKREIVVTLTQKTSAVLLDNQYGLTPAMEIRGGCGLLMSYEESGYSGDATYRKLIFNPDWTVEKIKKMGASAVKLLAYYHPHSGALADEIEGVIAEAVAECHRFDLPIFVEPMSYSLDANIAKESADFAAQRPQIVVDTAERLCKLGMDVLKLEFPVDAAFDDDRAGWQRWCEAVSRVSSVPWVLLSAGVDFEVFAEQAQIACNAGASGWLAGRAIWKEATAMSAADRTAFLTGTAMARTERLAGIATSSRPWTDFYAPPPASETWFK
ncbi:MAG: tagatose 1,6-diphosphate aldolase [bacterium]|nr:tagatose 1,6-diphosphate aldolase [bacterium]